MPTFPRSAPSPPPMRSPDIMPASLPTPPPIPRRTSSRSRLQLPLHPEEPPIPPRLIGSPLLQRFTGAQPQSYFMSERAQSELWLDGDEFGAKRKETAHLQPIAPPSPLLSQSPSTTPKRGPRRSPPSPASHNPRSRSPPPTPKISSPPPPVPPIPSSAFTAPGSKRSILHPHPGRISPQLSIPELVLSAPVELPSSPKKQRSRGVAT